MRLQNQKECSEIEELHQTCGIHKINAKKPKQLDLILDMGNKLLTTETLVFKLVTQNKTETLP